MAILTTTTGPQEGIDYINGKLDKTVGHIHDGTDENGGIINSQHIINTPSGDVTATNTQEAINQVASFVSLGRIHVPVRQTVLSGLTTGDNPSFLSVGTGLSINLLASTSPLILAFAYGFDNQYGQIDYVSSITSDQTAFWSNLPANQSFIQLYIDRNLTTGVLTGGYTERETAYGFAPSHFNTQHWYDYSNTTFMKVSDGSSWSNVQRIMVGECTTNADSVTSVVCYALQGRYESEWFEIESNQFYLKNPNIGAAMSSVDILVANSANLSIYKSINSRVATSAPTTYYGVMYMHCSKNTVGINTHVLNAAIAETRIVDSAGATVGAIDRAKIITKRVW